jgi:hypothetical protein
MLVTKAEAFARKEAAHREGVTVGEIGNLPAPSHTVQKAVDEWLDERDKDGKDNTKATHLTNKLLDWCRKNGFTRLAELESQRHALKVWRTNAQHAVAESVVLLSVRWETHAMPQSGMRPQEAVNRQLVSGCDMLVGMFWTKIGASTGVADSGTVEEIDQFVAAGSLRCCISPAALSIRTKLT